MAIVTVGIDLAKNVFAMHGVDEIGKLNRPDYGAIQFREMSAVEFENRSRT